MDGLLQSPGFSVESNIEEAERNRRRKAETRIGIKRLDFGRTEDISGKRKEDAVFYRRKEEEAKGIGESKRGMQEGARQPSEASRRREHIQ